MQSPAHSTSRLFWKRFLLCLVGCFSFSALNAEDYYFLPDGAGSKSGTDFENAQAWSDLSFQGVIDFLNTTMQPGDRLLMGSGTYEERKLTLTSNGEAGNPKEIIGIDTGDGRPLIIRDSWSRTDPGSGTHSHISLDGDGTRHWRISGIDLKGAQYAIYVQNNTNPHEDIVFSDMHISEVRYGLYGYDLRNVRFENVSVTNYTKHAFRLERGCQFVQFINCNTDLSDGDETWWDYAEAIPFGFTLIGDANDVNSNILFENCEARNNRQNGQEAGSYWNGDGFCVENPNNNVIFQNCRSFDNDDAGFDVKPESTFRNCIAIGNKRNFRHWYSDTIMINCMAGYPHSRGGIGSEVGFWFQKNNPTLENCTFYGDDGYAVHMDGGGSATVNNSLLAFSGSDGSYTLGSVTINSSTEKYRPGTGTDPEFISPSSTWHGIGTDFDSLLYTDSKGYYSSTSYRVTFQIEVNGEEQEVYPGVFNGSQDGDPEVSILDENSFRIVGNGWQMIGLRGVEITADTILEFDFTSTIEGELHAIGFDNDSGLSTELGFQFYGTQTWADNQIDNYDDTAPLTKHYTIPVGAYYTGEFSYLFFVHDHDVSNPDAESIYSNIRIYNPTPFTIWAAAKGLSSGINDSMEDDPDQDGKTNLYHFALDTEPLTNVVDENSNLQSESVEDAEDNENYLTLTIPVRKGASFSGSPLTSGSIDGIQYTIVATSELTANSPDLVVEEITAITSGMPTLGDYDDVSGADYEYHSFRLAEPIGSEAQAFLWVEISD